MSEELIPSQPSTTPQPHAGVALTLPRPKPTAEQRFWTKARIECAQLVAEGRLTIPQISEAIKKSPKWVNESKRVEWFKQRVNELREDLAEDARQFGIADQRMRLQQQQDRWLRMQKVIQERASSEPPRVQRGEYVYDPEQDEAVYKLYDKADLPEIPGWDTGVMVHEIKTNKDSAYDLYAVDTGLLSEMRALEAQVAKELGQTAEKDGAATSSTFVLIRERVIDRGQRLEPLG